MNKYEITDIAYPDNPKLRRILALIDIPSIGVYKGALGGYIEKEENLDQEGNCWVYENGRVFDNGRVYGKGQVYGDGQVCGTAWLSGNSAIRSGVLVDTDQILCIGPIGSHDGFTTFNLADGTVCCGCFYGTFEEFRKQVEKTYEEGSRHRGEYLSALQLAEFRRSHIMGGAGGQ